jgi:glycosyltransferase involved in cell wall biosynthesis
VIFTGFRKDIKNLYKGSDIYINSSQHEALSFLIIEAMAAGLPVIVTDMGGNRDIVPPDADCGALVVYEDPESMAQAMKRMLEDDAYRAGCAAGALRTVEEKFEVGKMCQLTWQVYEKARKG